MSVMKTSRKPLRQEERTDAARRTLIEATVKVIATEGYRKATFSRIQEVSGISRGLIGYHFGTKRVLVEEVAKSIRTSYWEQSRSRAPQGLSGRAGLDDAISNYLNRLALDPWPAKVMLVLGAECISEHSSIHAAVQEGYAELRGELRRFIELGLRDGSIRAGLDAVGYAAIFEALIRGTVLQYLLEPETFDLAAAQRAAADIVAQLAAPGDTRRTPRR